MDDISRKIQYYLKKYWLLLAIIVIAVVLAIGYQYGYRFGPGATLSRVGTLTLPSLPTGTSVYVDQSLRRTTSATSTVTIDLLHGNHTVIVSESGDYPWSTVTWITSGQRTNAAPVFIPMQPAVTPLTGDDKTVAFAAVASTTLPTLAKPMVLSSGCAVVYVSNNQVIEDASSTATMTQDCTPPPYLCIGGSCGATIIFAPIPHLSAVLPFPGRSDAIIVAFNNTLYALALDPRAPQFFAPILTGTNPRPGVLSDGTIVVQNNTVAYKVRL